MLFFCTKFVLFILFFIVKMDKDKPSLAIALRLNYKKKLRNEIKKMWYAVGKFGLKIPFF